MNILHESKHNDMNEVKKPIQDTKIEFNKKVELLKKSQIEMKLEMKTSISQINASMENLTNKIDHVENRMSRLRKWITQ